MTKPAIWKHFELNKKDSTWAKCKLCSKDSEQVKRG